MKEEKTKSMAESARQFVYSTIHGISADVLAQILSIYVRPGSIIADLTFNTGGFWRTLDISGYTLIASDLFPFPGLDLRTDMRNLPYRSGSFDAVIMDPPYGNGSTTPRTDSLQDRFNLEMVKTPKQILALYRDSIPEAHRILKKRGILILKCQDMVDGGRKHFMSVDICNHARSIGFRGEDKFNMVPPGKPMIRHPDRPQQHARKNHSEFWVFRKTS
jgi:tRNA G10  N-methylase Trm11